MRKFMILPLAATILLASCSSAVTSDVTSAPMQDQGDQPVITAEMPYSQETGASEAPKGINDLDLTQMSSTMIYAQVLNITLEPETYFGATIKMTGEFMSVHDDTMDIERYCCIVKDQAQCCMTGFELQFDGEFTPPEEGAEITVEGQLDFYEEEGARYLFLGHAVIK